MKNFRFQIWAGLLLVTANPAFAQVQLAPQAPADSAVLVTPDNFKRAETDMYLASFVKEGALGKFFHHRDLPVENTGVRPNRDTLYSFAVFDLDAGPVTLHLPDAGKRFMSLMVSIRTTTPLKPSTPRGTTPTRESRLAHAISSLQCALLSIRQTPRTSSRRGRCRMQSRSASRADPARSRRPTGTKQARTRCATRFLCSTRRCGI